MKVAVLSGKGGTGKTFVAVNLAYVMERVLYADCDVEAPNGNLFFKGLLKAEEIFVKVPQFDEEKCTGCKKCVDFCQFNALAFVGKKPMLFPEVCHACGGCAIVCKEGAVSEVERVVGIVETGYANRTQVFSGKLNIGEASGIPIIKNMQSKIEKTKSDTIIDCPPGSGCMVLEIVQEADYCLLVAEPTAFGLHNLKMVVDLVRVFNKPFGVILNKCEEKTNPTETYLLQEKIDIFGRIPYDNEIAKFTAEGKIAAREFPGIKKLFEEIEAILRKKVDA